MSLVVNHNMMSANTARILNQHYSRLNTSTQRLSSGLRINTAADDAAGLAIRELQRADIASLQQGARNANDAISLIQTADGALQVIDEKLIRMKELAEQAATGTYDSTQRLMIDSEYQAMASEITRIAKATDFNGIHLLNGNLASLVHDGSGMKSEGKMKIHFGTGNDSAEDYYYIQIKDSTAEAFSLGSNSTYENAVDRFANQMREQLKGALKGKIGDGTLTQAQYDMILGAVDGLAGQLLQSGQIADQNVLDARINGTALDATYTIPMDFSTLTADDKQKLSYYFGRDVVNGLAQGGNILNWNVYASDTDTTPGTVNALGNMLATIFSGATSGTVTDATNYKTVADTYAGLVAAGTAGQADATTFATAVQAYEGAGGSVSRALHDAAAAHLAAATAATTAALAELVPAAQTAANAGVAASTAAKFITQTATYVGAADTYLAAVAAGIAGQADATTFATAVQAYEGAGGSVSRALHDAAAAHLAAATPATTADLAALASYAQQEAVKAKAGADSAKVAADIAFADTLSGGVIGMVNAAARTAARDFIDIHDYDGMNIATQENAQIALDAINKAIVEKDKIRANLGSLQNRLENTISNLNIQAENLQAAESRISDVDVSTEMTEFVRNQILTQSAVAMLAQANSLPKMAMQLISG